MIKSVTITNEFGESIDITLGETEPETGLFIKGIDGLGPPGADITFGNVVTQDGGKYNSAKGNQRNVVFHLIFLDAQTTVESARQITYKYFPLKKKVNVIVETENRMAEAEGYVESNEPIIFHDEGDMVGADISIMCESSWLHRYGPEGIQEIRFSDINAMFEFEFEDVDELSPSIEFSAIEVKRENVINYHGEADTGIIMSIYAYDRFRFPTIYNNITRESMKIDTDKVERIIGSQIKFGDEIRISTHQNNKYIHFIRDGVTTNILNALDKNADWFKIHPGDNTFSYTMTQGELDVVFMITADVLLQGV